MCTLRILLQKMTKIITSIPPELLDPNLGKPNKSLNARGRSTEMDRISVDNQKILHRMMSVTSMHDHKKMKAEFKHHNKLLKRLAMVKYTPSEASLSQVSKRGLHQNSAELSSVAPSHTFTSTDGTSVDMDSVLSQSQSHAKSHNTHKSHRKKGNKLAKTVPAQINTSVPGTPTAEDNEEVMFKRRNSTKDELTLLGQAALMDQETEAEDQFDEVKQDQQIEKLMKNNNVTNPRARKLTKRLSALDMSRGEYNLVKQTKGVAVLREGVPVDRDQALVAVTKKRDGRIRVHVKNAGTTALEINCFEDIGVVEARELLGVENKHYFGDDGEGAKASAAKREELLELSWGLIDFAQVQYEMREDGGEKFVVAFVNPIMVAQQSILPGGKLGSFGGTMESFGSGMQGSLDGSSFPGSSTDLLPLGKPPRPSTAEIIAVVAESRDVSIVVADAPETELVKTVSVKLSLKNKRRPGVVDIVATVTGGNKTFCDMIEGGVLLTSVGIPTLVSIDPELTTSYVHGLIGSLKVQLVNMDKRDGENVDVGPRLLVRGGRPQTTPFVPHSR